ncbi:Uncharacterised protein [Vibrio cholerae]|nr:Uncharacterised protein [Vibrio cholerae]CSB69899.1 Uncharacterised protein [Vibrio cholerae]CSC12031.1 Uncharacterised protein [Vibrio cholerae]CSD08895.1 Uncharacterised protein [Vibrio cholerae]
MNKLAWKQRSHFFQYDVEELISARQCRGEHVVVVVLNTAILRAIFLIDQPCRQRFNRGAAVPWYVNFRDDSNATIAGVLNHCTDLILGIETAMTLRE